MGKSTPKIINRIEHIAGQLVVILGLLATFFYSAWNSELYSVWVVEVTKIVRRGSKVNIALFLFMLVVWAVSLYAVRDKKRVNLTLFAGMGMMFIVHYLIRIRIIPTYQMDDGLIYYKELNRLINHPERLLDNFYNGGRLASHISHGYIFFTAIGEFMMPGAGYGFQWSQLFMGIGAACCLYGIFMKLFPKVKAYVLWIAAFIVSVQPMFFGLSTYCNLEYGVTVFFIYAFYCYLNRKYILLAFWLLMLGTTKEPGTMMAIVFVGAIVMSELIAYVRANGIKRLVKKLDAKWISVIIFIFAVLVFAAYKILNMQVWGGHVLKDVIGFGGEGNMTFRISFWHLKIKLSQLFVLNFSWISAAIVIIGIICAIIRKAKGIQPDEDRRLPFKQLCTFGICFGVYAFFLLFYQEAKQTRYNMLFDVLFLMITMMVFIKLAGKVRIQIPALIVWGSLIFVQAFVTIDFVSIALFTNVVTNRLPMVFTLTHKDEMEVLNNNAGDFAFYNYQYTFVDRAIDEMLRERATGGMQWIFSAFDGCESQLYYDDLRWDIVEGKRCYEYDPTRYLYIKRVYVFDYLAGGEELPEKAVLMESPWCKSEDWDKAIEELAKYYHMSGPYEADEGLAGTVIYYLLDIK